MRLIKDFYFLTLSMATITSCEIIISQDLAKEIGKKIWYNECKGSKEQLTWWKEQEPCACVGIGHFLWYPQTTGHQLFRESFPELRTYLEKHGKELPAKFKGPCPWASRKEFFNNFDSNDMKQLQKFLYETRGLQVDFIISNFSNKVEAIIKYEKDSVKKAHLKKQISRLIAVTSKGLYALIDYVNFKGPGIIYKENHNNTRWGLLQVLEQMQEEKSPLEDFVKAAKMVLNNRVFNNPKDSRWLKGWHNRLDSYLN